MKHFLSKNRGRLIMPKKCNDENNNEKMQKKCILKEKNTKTNSKASFTRWLRNVRAVLEDWLFLALLGILVAICSLAMDLAIEHLQGLHVIAIDYVKANTHEFENLIATYFVWSGYTVLLVLCSAFLVRLIAPQAIGSGIPEMKTILRGVILKEYLTFRTLLSKMLGLTLSLGSGLPIGKEGPFVHIASVVANLLSQFVQSFEGIYSNESREKVFEVLAAACAVGVSSTFSAPIGGVLFSIEVTSVYFAVRNYWRGFFAATCSATLFRILKVLLNETEVTVTAYYQTQFPRDAFFPEELPVFAFIGVLCGFLSAAFIYFQRRCVLFLRRNAFSKSLFQKHWVIYPALISLIVGSLTYPTGFGRFLGGEKKFSQTAKDFFANCSWSLPSNSTHYCPVDLHNTWTNSDEFSVFTSLPCFICTYFILSILTSTLPIPSGIFGPSFVVGAAIGRFIGELMVLFFPDGIRGPDASQIFPGVYAIVGSAALTGGVTHTVSVAVIVFELTGQLLHILPVMIAVLIANAISSYLQPSIYDSAIRIKHLPYLPDIPHTSTRFHGIFVDRFMTNDVKFFTSHSTSYSKVQQILSDYPQLKSFPIVENPESRILIGSCSRSRLMRSLNALISQTNRQQEANKRARITKKHSIDQKLLNKSTKEKEGEIGEPQQQIQRTRSDSEIMENRGNGEVKFDVANGQIVDDSVAEAGKRFTVLTVPKATMMANFYESKPFKANSSISTNLIHSPTLPTLQTLSTNGDVYSTIGGMIKTLTRLSNRLRKNFEDLPNECDLVGEERAEWEKEQLAKMVDFGSIGVDPAPFQLVEQTSLVKVHSIFSLLGLNRAYVLKCGRLIGVVALKDLREAIEQVQSGELIAKSQQSTENDIEEGGELNGNNANKGGNAENEDYLSEEDHADEEDEDGQQNDILNPRLEIATKPDSMYGKTERKISTTAADMRIQVKKASMDALKGAMNLLTNNRRAGRRESIAEERNEQNSAPKTPLPIFVISSSSDNED